MNEPAHDSDQRKPPRGVLGTIFLTVFIDLIGFSIIFPLFPAMLDHYIAIEEAGSLFDSVLDLLRRFSSDDARLSVLFGGLLGSLYSTLQFVFAPIWGRLSDRVGRRPVLLMTVSGIALSYVVWFFSGSFTLLVAARLLGGIMSGNISVATAAIADSTGTRERGRGMALIGIAFGLGFTLGPALGGALTMIDLTELAPSLTSWGVNPFSAAAAGALLLSALNLAFVLRRLPETLPEADRDRTRTERTANPLKLFGRGDAPGVDGANFTYFVYFLAFSAMEFTLVFLARDRLGYTPRDNLWMFVFVGLLMALVQGGIVRRLAPRLGERKLARAGIILTLPGFVITGLATSTPALYAGLAFLATGGALVTPCLSALVSLYTPPARQGAVLGVFRSLGALARAVGPILGCAIYWRYGSEAPYLAAAVVVLLPLALSFRLPAPS